MRGHYSTDSRLRCAGIQPCVLAAKHWQPGAVRLPANSARRRFVGSGRANECCWGLTYILDYNGMQSGKNVFPN